MQTLPNQDTIHERQINIEDEDESIEDDDDCDRPIKRSAGSYQYDKPITIIIKDIIIQHVLNVHMMHKPWDIASCSSLEISK